MTSQVRASQSLQRSVSASAGSAEQGPPIFNKKGLLICDTHALQVRASQGEQGSVSVWEAEEAFELEQRAADASTTDPAMWYGIA